MATQVSRVGSVRPSQLMYTYGVGAVIDLPGFAVLVGGLDDWDTLNTKALSEPRLLAAVREELGPQVEQLLTPPWMNETPSLLDEWTRVGVPVLPFPRWMRCPRCDLLTSRIANDGTGLFNLKTAPGRPDASRFVHTSCTRANNPTVIPARFVVACSDGHVDEFPWVEFCHSDSGAACAAPSLTIRDLGSGARSIDLIVKCGACGASKALHHAFNESRKKTMPACRGREAHLKRFKNGGCAKQVKPLLLGASNAWFPLTRSALSIPAANSRVARVVGTLIAELVGVQSADDLAPAMKYNPALKPLGDFAPADVWEVLCAIRGVGGDDAGDLLRPEWEVLIAPESAPADEDFRIVASPVPGGYAGLLGSVVRAERLREVVAYTGFTRLDAPDSGVAEDLEVPNRAPISRNAPTWVPSAETRGEGIFLTLDEAVLRDWEDRAGTSSQGEALRAAHERWRLRRNLSAGAGWRGMRYLLLHSLSHLLINELAMECGYSAASIRERIYCSEGGPTEAMAGVLLYTAAPDSEGTLGGLVSLARPDTLGRLLDQALTRAHLCGSDPLCAEHLPHETEDSLHGAACHSCLFVPETSCERGNRYLDRTLAVPTLARADLAFFPDSR
jgi:hypothetical protein